MNEHFSKQFDAELDALRADVTRMGGLVEAQVRAALKAFSDGDQVLAEEVIAQDRDVDNMEIVIDESCVHIVARRQPAAIDLRMIMAVGKTVTDLERIGDEAKKIAKGSRKMQRREANQWLAQVVEIRHVGERVGAMLQAVLDSFVRLDVEAAAAVVRQDEDIDQHFRAIVRHLVTHMMEDPRTITTALDVVFIAKSIERIGDHCKNIAEDVIYIAKGRDVRHIGLAALESEVKAS